MQYRQLSPSCGLKVSRIILGCMSFGSSAWQDWVVEEDKAIEVLKHAWDAGVTTFDTADVYSNGLSEIILGKFIKKYNIPRERIVILTKLFSPVFEGDWARSIFKEPALMATLDQNTYGLNRKHIFHAVKDSLRRLQVDYIDLYQIHRWDATTPIEETMEALNDLVRQGLVHYIGASSMYAHQFYKAQLIAEKHGWAKFVSMQNLYCASYREEEREMLPCCEELGVGVIPWSPLARGALCKPVDDSADSSKRQGSDRFSALFYAEDKKGVRRAVEQVAKQRGVSMAQIALAWCLHDPVVTAPIIGATKTQHLDELIAALDINLTDEEYETINKAYVTQPVTFGTIAQPSRKHLAKK